MANKNSIYVNALTQFILDTKPYHCKLTEIQEIYQFADSMTVNITERLFSNTTTKAAWLYSYFSDGIPELSLGLGKPMPMHQLVNPLVRGYTRNSDPVESRGAFKAFRDENINLPLVPFAFDPKSIQGVGLSDAFVQRDGLKQFNEPILEGHDFHLSHGAYVFQIKQTLNPQAPVVGRFTDVYEVTDGPFPIAVALPFTNADTLVIIGPAVQVTLSSISVTGPGVVKVYGLSTGPNYDAQFTERKNELLISTASTAAAVTDPTLTSQLARGYFSDIGVREEGDLDYKDVVQGVLTISNIVADPIHPVYEEWTLTAVSPTTLLISGSSSGSVATIVAGTAYSSTDLAFSTAVTGALTVGEEFVLTPSAKITIHYQAPLEAWSLISTNPVSYTRPVFSSTRYGYLLSSTLVRDYITVLDIALPSGTLILTATSPTSFTLTSTAEPLYTGTVTVNSPFNDGRVAFTIVAGSAYAFSVGDRFFIEIENAPPFPEDLDLYYGFDLDSYDAENIVYNNLNALAANYLDEIGFGYDSRFIGYDTATFGLQIAQNATDGTPWRLRALPDLAQPLLLQSSTPTNQLSVIATDDPLNPLAIVQFDMANDVTAEGPQSANDPDVIADLRLFYSTSFALEYYDTGISGWIQVGVVPVGSTYTNSTYGLSFTLVPADKPFISGQLNSSWFPATSGPFSAQLFEGGDTISWITRNPPPAQTEPAGITGSRTPRLIMYGESFHDTTPARWTLSWTGTNTYAFQGIYTTGPLNGSSVFASPIVVNTANDGRSYRNDEHNVHFTVVTGIAGLLPNDSFSFETFDAEPTFLVHGSVSGWQPNATIGEWYWNGKIGFKIPVAVAKLFSVGGARIGDVPPWSTAYGPIVLAELRKDAPTATYTLRSHTPGHFTLYRNGNVIDDGGDAANVIVVGDVNPVTLTAGLVVTTAAGPVTLVSGDLVLLSQQTIGSQNGVYRIPLVGTAALNTCVLSDQYIKLLVPGGPAFQEYIVSVEGHEYSLVEGHDLAILRSTPGRMPTADDFVLLERNEADTLQISIKAKDVTHQLVLNELAPAVTDLRFVDHNANSGVPLSATSPETAVLTGWLPTLQTWFDRTLSVAEFSDAATHVEVRSAATGEKIGVVQSLTTNPAEPVIFRWDPAFHAKYLPINSEATVVSLGSGMDEHVNVNMRDSVMFLIAGDSQNDDVLFNDNMNVAFIEDNQWLINASYQDLVGVAMADGPFGGFLPGFDNVPFDFELGPGDVNNENSPDAYYDAGVPLTDYFMQAQALALLPSMTPPQQALFNDLISLLQPYLDAGGDIITTTLAEFLANIDAAGAPNWTPTFAGFGIPALGMGMEIEQDQIGTASANIVEAMTVIATDAGYSFDQNGYGIGPMDETPNTYAIVFSATAPPLPPTGLPPPLTPYNLFDTPLVVNAPGGRVVELSFKDPVPTTPTFYLWRPAELAPSLVPVVERISQRQFRFSLPVASELKLILV